MDKPGEPYYPSNGTEGYSFIDYYCMNCLHCDPDPEGEKQCMILCRTLVHSPKDPEYPKEWTYNEKGEPICTNHVKWDWGNDGNPDDPDNPNNPPSVDPDQLSLFPLYPSELDFEPVQTRREAHHG